MLFVHAGLPKVGSTTIQAFLRENEGRLATLGVSHVKAGRNEKRHLPLQHALLDPTSGRQVLDEFAGELDAGRDRHHVISSEGFHKAIHADDRSGVELLARYDPLLIFYLREYGSRMPSLYAQRIVLGRGTDGFDEFFAHRRATWSPLPMLKDWAVLVGWERMRIRSIDPRSLVGGDLLADFTAAMGIRDGDALARPERRAVSPHWMVLEYKRALLNALEPLDPVRSRHAVKALVGLFRECFDAGTFSKENARYLTAQQAREAAVEYNREMEELSALTGFRIPAAATDGFPERPFLPTLGEIPRSLRRQVHDRVPSAVGKRTDDDIRDAIERFRTMLIAG